MNSESLEITGDDNIPLQRGQHNMLNVGTTPQERGRKKQLFKNI